MADGVWQDSIKLQLLADKSYSRFMRTRSWSPPSSSWHEIALLQVHPYYRNYNVVCEEVLHDAEQFAKSIIDGCGVANLESHSREICAGNADENNASSNEVGRRREPHQNVCVSMWRCVTACSSRRLPMSLSGGSSAPPNDHHCCVRGVCGTITSLRTTIRCRTVDPRRYPRGVAGNLSRRTSTTGCITLPTG